MFEKKRLHPVTIISNIISQLREAIFPIIIFLFFGSRGEEIESFWDWFLLCFPFIIILFSLLAGFIKWLRYTYWLEDGEIRIEYGLFIRKKRYIPFERIQSISLSEGILQRIFGLVKLTIETAGIEIGAEAILTAISKEEAGEIQRFIKTKKEKDISSVLDNDEDGETGKKETADTLTQQSNTVTAFTMSTKDNFILAITSGGALGVIAAVLAFITQFDELIPYDQVFSEIRRFIASWLILAGTVLFVILVAYFIAIIRTMFKYANFTVEKSEENILVSYGLIEKRNITIPIKRVQGIRIDENFIRGFLGYSTVSLVSAGGAANEGAVGSFIICPLIKKTDVKSVIELILPDYRITEQFTKVPIRARSRYITRPILALILPVLLGIYFLKVWGLLLLLILPIAAYIGYQGYLFAGWSVSGDELVLRSRWVNKRTLYMKKNRIQSLKVSCSYLQKRKNLGSISATLMAGIGGITGKTVDIEENDLQTVYQWYSNTDSETK